MQIILCPGGESKRKGQSMCCLCAGSDPFNRMLEFIDRAIRIACRVLNRASHEPGSRSEANRFGYYLCGVTETLFQVGAHGQLGGRDDLRGVCQRFLAIEAVVEPPTRECISHAGCG